MSNDYTESDARAASALPKITFSRRFSSEWYDRETGEPIRNGHNDVPSGNCHLISPCSVGVSNVTLPMLDAALAYAQDGFYVVALFEPIGEICSCTKGARCSNVGKHPRTPHGLSDATTDATVICEWWTRWPNANIGIACGPSNICVLDIDVKGFPRWAKLCADVPAILAGPRQRSGGSSEGDHAFHHFFSFDNARKPLRTSRALGEGIDFIGDGGMVVVAPSMHKSGRRYSWLDCDGNPRRATLPYLPAALQQRLNPPVSQPIVARAVSTHAALRPWHESLLSKPWSREYGTQKLAGSMIAIARERIRISSDYEAAYLTDLNQILANSPDLWNPSRSGRRENPVDKEIRSRSLLRFALAHPQSWSPVANLTPYLLRERSDTAKGVVALYESLAAYAIGQGIPHECISIDYARLSDLLGGTIDKKQVARWAKAAERCSLIFIVDRGRARSLGSCGTPSTFAILAEGESLSALRENAERRFSQALQRRPARFSNAATVKTRPNDELRGWARVLHHAA